MAYESFDRPSRHMKSKVLTTSTGRDERRDTRNVSSSLEDYVSSGLKPPRRLHSRESAFGLPREENVSADPENVPNQKDESQYMYKKGMKRSLSKSRRTQISAEESEKERTSFASGYARSSYNDAKKKRVEARECTNTENSRKKKVVLTPPFRVYNGSNRMTPLMAAANRMKPRQQPNCPIPPTPFLRQTSSTYSVYGHHDFIPPPLRLTSTPSKLRLMSEPLPETPAQQSGSGLPWLTPVTDATSSTKGINTTTLERMGSSSWMLPFTTPNIVPDAVEGLLSMEKGCPMKKKDITSGKPRSRTSMGDPLGQYYSESTKTPHPSGGSTPKLPMKPSFQRKVLSAFPKGFNEPPFAPQLDTSLPKSGYYTESGHTASSKTSVYHKSVDTALLSAPAATKGKKPKDLFKNVPFTDRPCKCSTTRCLKLYCECFHNGKFCDDKLCTCKNCRNNEENNESRGPREIAIKRILARRPDAFVVKVQKRTGNGCGCKTCFCLKKYCECVALGKSCSQQCTCVDCRNTGH